MDPFLTGFIIGASVGGLFAVILAYCCMWWWIECMFIRDDI